MYLRNLSSASRASVHFVLSEELKDELGSLAVTVIEGSIAAIKTENDFFAVISDAMQFPGYFGSNWDALDECLTDMEWMPSEGYLLVLRNAAKGWSQNPYVLGRFVASWLEASEFWAENSKPFHLLFVM